MQDDRGGAAAAVILQKGFAAAKFGGDAPAITQR